MTFKQWATYTAGQGLCLAVAFGAFVAFPSGIKIGSVIGIIATFTFLGAVAGFVLIGKAKNLAGRRV